MTSESINLALSRPRDIANIDGPDPEIEHPKAPSSKHFFWTSSKDGMEKSFLLL